MEVRAADASNRAALAWRLGPASPNLYIIDQNTLYIDLPAAILGGQVKRLLLLQARAQAAGHLPAVLNAPMFCFETAIKVCIAPLYAYQT